MSAYQQGQATAAIEGQPTSYASAAPEQTNPWSQDDAPVAASGGVTQKSATANDADLVGQEVQASAGGASSLNYNRQTGEGFATEMDRHAIHAAKAQNLIPQDADEEEMLHGRNKTDKNAQAFEEALEKPDLMAAGDHPDQENL
ncbi:hypothetical protein BZG36_00804 [Bifiguratus adelaidae]|uniref:Uncharacterized protein n=1 Tax=Bifiguratus adelaidae TaxID=1938954 RepID=A0A261Y6K2_9FUNG|nr:hypothetical protein BZG36_00804 [Bifiguratus adelaidae]